MVSQETPDYLRVKTPEEVREILSRLRQGLEALYQDRLEGLYLYGSYARGDARPGSDLDVLGVLNAMDSPTEEIERTSRLCAEISLDHGITVSLLLRSADHWRTAVTPLIRSVRSEGLAAWRRSRGNFWTVKSGDFDAKFHRWLLTAFRERQEATYDLDEPIAEARVAEGIGRAEGFLTAAKEHLAAED
jgi:uncharacterized protein